MVKLMSAKGKIRPEDQKYVHIIEKKTEQWLREEKQKSLKVNSMNSLSDNIRRDTLGDRPGVNLKKSYHTGLYNAGSTKGYGSPDYMGGPGTDTTRYYKTTNRGPKKDFKGPYEIWHRLKDNKNLYKIFKVLYLDKSLVIIPGCVAYLFASNLF